MQRVQPPRRLARLDIVPPKKPQKHSYSERQLEDMCRLLYETPGGATWATMSELSPTLRQLTRQQAIRVLDWHHERLAEETLL